MSKALLRGIVIGADVLGLLAAVAIAPWLPSARAQSAVNGSPIPSPIPVNPNTGHSLRHSRSAARNYRTTVRRPVRHYPVRRGSKAPASGSRIVRDGIGQPFVIIDSAPVRVIRDRFGNEVFILDTDGRGNRIRYYQ